MEIFIGSNHDTSIVFAPKDTCRVTYLLLLSANTI